MTSWKEEDQLYFLSFKYLSHDKTKFVTKQVIKKDSAT